MIVGDVNLPSKGDLFWVKDEKPVVHLECENAISFRKITEELRNLGSSNIPHKIGVFQLTTSGLDRNTVRRAKRFLDKNRLIGKARWLLIFDIWHDIEIEDVEYDYTNNKGEYVTKNYEFECYPLIGMILNERTDRVKRMRIYRFPFGRLGLGNYEEKWE